jgi:hypothetical protein
MDFEELMEGVAQSVEAGDRADAAPVANLGKPTGFLVTTGAGLGVVGSVSVTSQGEVFAAGGAGLSLFPVSVQSGFTFNGPASNFLTGPSITVNLVGIAFGVAPDFNNLFNSTIFIGIGTPFEISVTNGIASTPPTFLGGTDFGNAIVSVNDPQTGQNQIFIQSPGITPGGGVGIIQTPVGNDGVTDIKGNSFSVNDAGQVVMTTPDGQVSIVVPASATQNGAAAGSGIGAGATPNQIVAQGFAALDQSQNGGLTPNQVVAQEFAALQQSQNGGLTPNQVVAQEFAALEQSQNGGVTPNQIVAQEFAALEQSQNGGLTPNQIVTQDFNTLDQSQNNSLTPNDIVAQDFATLLGGDALAGGAAGSTIAGAAAGADLGAGAAADAGSIAPATSTAQALPTSVGINPTGTPAIDAGEGLAGASVGGGGSAGGGGGAAAGQGGGAAAAGGGGTGVVAAGGTGSIAGGGGFAGGIPGKPCRCSWRRPPAVLR